jgi:NarL family two-component system sensor histidine kinase YdfH
VEVRVQRLSLSRLLKDDDVAAGLPFYLFLLLILAVLYVVVLVTDEAMRQPLPLALFTGLMVVHGALHWSSMRLVQQPARLTVYCLVQGALAFVIGYLTRSTGVVMGLYLALVGETIGLLWPRRRAVAAAAAFFLGLMALNIILLWGGEALLGFLPVVGGTLVFVLLYVAFYIRQVTARGQAQTLLRELEVAHRQLQEYAEQIEELTINQERQRMARELHDTLAQGLAGLIMQLEAADSYLDTDNTKRAQAVVRQAMQRARTTLDEARRAIQALRTTALEQGNLVDALGYEVDRFAATTGTRATFEVVGATVEVAPEVAQDVLRIVQECLSNIARHAQAGQVRVRLARDGTGVEVVVHDDGVGFDPAEAHTRSECFGLTGMEERARRIGGQLQIESAPGSGTRVVLRLEEQGV